MEDLWVRVRKLVNLADKATVTITGLRDAAGSEVVLALRFELGECVSYTEGPPPQEELTNQLNDTVACLASAIRKVEELPHSERRALMYSMLCNQGKVLGFVLGLARQEEREP